MAFAAMFHFINRIYKSMLSSFIDDKIWVKYRPGGVTAVLQDVKCFEADWYDTTIASFVFELSGAKTKKNVSRGSLRIVHNY